MGKKEKKQVLCCCCLVLMLLMLKEVKKSKSNQLLTFEQLWLSCPPTETGFLFLGALHATVNHALVTTRKTEAESHYLS